MKERKFMILSCPKCSSRFLVSAAVLGEEGKKVRCTSCAHVWFQEPDAEALVELEEIRSAEVDEVLEDAVAHESFQDDLVSEDGLEAEAPTKDDMSFDEVLEVQDSSVDADDRDNGDDSMMEGHLPRSILPDQSDSDLDFVDVEKHVFLKKIYLFIVGERVSVKAMIGGFCMSALLVLSVCFALLSNPTETVRENPYLFELYSIFGISPDLPGEGLVFNELSADITGEGLVITGEIINLYKDDQIIPRVVGTALNEDNRQIFKAQIPIKATSIAQGEKIAFKAQLNAERLSGDERLSLGFELRPQDVDED